MTLQIQEVKKRYGTFAEWLKNEYEGPFCATDILIEPECEKEEGLVIAERKFPPYGIAVPGGVAEKMIFPANGKKEGKEETGLDIVIIDPIYRPFCVLSDVDQDPRAFMAVMVYRARGYGQIKPDRNEDVKRARFYNLDELADLLRLPVLNGKEDSNRGWAFPHHKTEVALYLLSKNHKFTRKRQETIQRIYDNYITSQDRQMREMEETLRRRYPKND